MEYFKFVEDYQKKHSINKFERVLVASKRAKDILEGKKPLVDPDEHKATSLAQFEVNNSLIDYVIKDKEEVFEEDDDEEDE